MMNLNTFKFENNYIPYGIANSSQFENIAKNKQIQCIYLRIYFYNYVIYNFFILKKISLSKNY